MSRFFVPRTAIREGKAYIGGEEAHHLRDVMRYAVGDRLTIFDGHGSEYDGRIESAGRGSVVVSLCGERAVPAVPALSLELVQALPKQGKMDDIVQKATELGVSRIVPVITARTIVRPDDTRVRQRVLRWRKIATESAKQCGRADVPRIEEVVSYADALSACGAPVRIMAALSERAEPLERVLAGSASARIAVYIGPEGDFTPAEVDAAVAAGCRIVSLGPRVLRVDTAACYLLSIVQYRVTS